MTAPLKEFIAHSRRKKGNNTAFLLHYSFEQMGKNVLKSISHFFDFFSLFPFCVVGKLYKTILIIATTHTQNIPFPTFWNNYNYMKWRRRFVEVWYLYFYHELSTFMACFGLIFSFTTISASRQARCTHISVVLNCKANIFSLEKEL